MCIDEYLANRLDRRRAFPLIVHPVPVEVLTVQTQSTTQVLKYVSAVAVAQGTLGKKEENPERYWNERISLTYYVVSSFQPKIWNT